MRKTKNLLSLFFNAANVILVALSVIGFFVSTGSGNMQVAGMAAFIIKWITDGNLTEDKAVALLSDILLHAPSTVPKRLGK